MKHIKYYLILGFYVAFGLCAFGQTPPVDLANLSLGDLLNAKIIRSHSDHAAFKTGGQDTPLGYLDSSRFHFSTNYINVKFEGYMDGTKDLSTDDVLWHPINDGKDKRTDKNFPVVPTIIHQEAIQFKGAYDLSERFSLSLSIP